MKFDDLMHGHSRPTPEIFRLIADDMPVLLAPHAFIRPYGPYDYDAGPYYVRSRAKLEYCDPSEYRY